MREIKFRVWDLEEKEMLFFEGIFNDTCSFDAHNDIDDFSDIMQYTGLKDKNGKEIYEGDLIYYTCNGFNGKVTRDYKVGFDEEKGRFVLYDLNAKFGYYDDFYPTIYNSLEIIGNIYENPELLK